MEPEISPCSACGGDNFTTCPEHPIHVANITTMSRIMKIFGTLFCLLIVSLITVVSISVFNLSEYKLSQSEELSSIKVDIAIIKSDGEYNKEGIRDIKNMLIKRQVFAETPLDTSRLVVRELP